MNLVGLKLVIIGKDFSDREVEEIFLSTIVNSEDELKEITECLTKHRPEVAKKIEATIKAR